MKKMIASLLTLTLLAPALASAHPGGWGPPGGWEPHEGWGRHGGPAPRWGGPGPLRFLPEAATAVLIGGLTYYLLNGNYYQRHGEEYVVVAPPPETRISGEMRVLDFNGRHFYVQDGHYYQREIDGDYVDVRRPSGFIRQCYHPLFAPEGMKQCPNEKRPVMKTGRLPFRSSDYC